VTAHSVMEGVVHVFVNGQPFTAVVGEVEKASILTLVTSTTAWIETGVSEEDCRARLSSNQAFVDRFAQHRDVFEPPPTDWQPWRNPTEFMLLLWVMSFGITRRAYLGIRRIVRASFSHYAEKVQWPTWPVLTGRVTAALPVLPLHIADVPAGGKTVRFPFHRLPDVIRRLLMWPGAFEKMVFEPRKGGQSSELWHGDRWASSPLFSYLQLNGSDGTDFSLGADVEFLDGGELRCGRIISTFRREEPDGSTGELRCVITPYTSDPVLEYHYAQRELLLDWSRRLEVVASDLHALVEISKCRCHADGLFSDTVLLRSPAGDPVTTVPREEMPGRPFDNIRMTEDFAAFERARAEHPDLKVLTLFVVTSCVAATVCVFVRGIILVCICIVADC
jgi:hypothetical protein